MCFPLATNFNIIAHKTAIFIVTVVKTSNLSCHDENAMSPLNGGKLISISWQLNVVWIGFLMAHPVQLRFSCHCCVFSQGSSPLLAG
jgi:hypothetical protein